MPESFLGDGLIFDDVVPLGWTRGPLPHEAELVRLNADNHQLLGAESSLDDVRVQEGLKAESPAVLHELQRLEFKLNVILRLTAELVRHHNALPTPCHVKLAAEGLEWIGDEAPAVGSTGMIELYVNAAFPQPLKLPATVIDRRVVPGGPIAQMQFSGLSAPVVDLIEKFIFRHHRRLVAGSRLIQKMRG